MKLHGAKKAAFLRRMAAGRAKARRRNPERTTAARTVVIKPITIAAPKGKPRVGSQLVYMVQGPTGRLASRIGNPRRRRKKTTKKRKQMAHLRRNRKGQFLPRARNAAVANPKRRRKAKRRAAPARARARRRRPTKAITHRRRGHKRRYPHTVIFKKPNPRRRRRRARNPSFGGIMSTVKSSAMPMVMGGVAGLSAGYMDAKFLGSRPTVSVLAKVGLALLGAAALGRKRPMLAAGWAGGMIGSTGYHAGVKFGGGMVGLSPAGALKGIADMAADDPEMANMIAGLGDVVDDGAQALGDDAAEDYNAVLEDSDDDLADVVDAEAY
jgi:hypothetical protein